MTTSRPKSLSERRFGQRAQRYVTSQAHATGTDLDRLVEIARPHPDWSVLDVATGGGHTALKFAPYVEHVLATDLTFKMLKVAEIFITTQGAENVTFQLADAQDLPFDDAAFDLVTCRIAPHHFNDCARFVRECARVLRHPDPATGAPGGILLVQDHVLPEDQAAARYADDFERLRDPSHHRAFAESEWVGMFQGAGLVVTHMEQIVKQHEFLPWAERQDCSSDVIARLVMMLQQAPEAAAAWMQPTDIGTHQAAFVNHHILIAGHRGT
jgi:ubiquinone/menaquinone biosynthesis C-methylase UbiE